MSEPLEQISIGTAACGHYGQVFRTNKCANCYIADLEPDAERFRHLQNIPFIEAQQFFWNFRSRKQRAQAIDKAMKKAK